MFIIPKYQMVRLQISAVFPDEQIKSTYILIQFYKMISLNDSQEQKYKYHKYFSSLNLILKKQNEGTDQSLKEELDFDKFLNLKALLWGRGDSSKGRRSCLACKSCSLSPQHHVVPGTSGSNP